MTAFRAPPPAGSRIDRTQPLRFTFDGVAYEGYRGDTLASALLANGVHLVARSFKYHRPRGIYAAGSEEPNALVRVGSGARATPNTRATEIELFDGLVAESQNRWPSLALDVASMANRFSALLPAGFYYKTFMWPRWLFYEPFIRAAGGMGIAPDGNDPDDYEHQHAHCDVLVVGAGRSGVAAAHAAAEGGARVLLCDERRAPAVEGVQVLARTTAFGYYDHGLVGMVELGARQRLWKVRAREVVLATGAIEQPLVFGNNDLPGVMLAGAMLRYAREFGVLPGKRVALAGHDLQETAAQLKQFGAEIVALIDGGEVIQALGRARIEGVEFGNKTIACDALGVSGGFQPAVHLMAQARGAARVRVVGSAARPAVVPSIAGFKGAKRFVDLQNDVTVEDIELAVREGYRSIEHVKRYTTLGMGTDQGKTSNLAGAALLAERLGRPLAEVGTTTFRPPYTPVTLGALAGRERGAHAEPTRLTPLHEWHASYGARFINAGLWLRPQLYPRPGESDEACIEREARNVRSRVGMVDVSTLGKIELQGPDVAEFLNRVYINNWHTLAVGRARYGVMLREDGFVFDDGTTSRLAERHYLMTTTTANAEAVLRHLEFLLQVAWPELRVHLASVTEQWAAATLAGPNARATLQKLSDVEVPFLGVRTCRVAGIPARVLRVSYSGELAYEIHVPAAQGIALWEALGVEPYGTEAMGVLRIEKGHIVVGAEADGRTTADDLGLGALVAQKYCVGKRLLERPAFAEPDRWQLVGLTALDGGRSLPRGAKLLRNPNAAMEGHITSWCYSPQLEAPIALGLLAAGRQRHGEVLWGASPLTGQSARVRVGPPCFFDPEGERLRG
jgi:glycine cleavage system aminomethyltransferase T/NADPH-dependent 2,4-dienoyl-CoA reductase/sulfur reductase-like enzyme